MGRLSAPSPSARLPECVHDALQGLLDCASPHLRAVTLPLPEEAPLLRFDFTGPRAAHDTIKVGIFAGIHGDEPAGTLAAARLLQQLLLNPRLAAGYALMVYPAINRQGLAAGTRGDARGIDLNREFWRGSEHPVVRTLETELRREKFHGIIALHADDTCEGLYGYAHGRLLNEELLRPALRASERHLPLDRRPLIDGFAADAGVIHFCFPGVLAAPADQAPAPFDIIFETPARAPLDLQAAAMVDGVSAVLSEYRRFIAFGADL
jgi:hypothetical protein